MKLLTKNPNKWQPELVKEYPTFISGQYPLRVYRAKENKPQGGTWYRWFFGFPENVVPEAIQFLLNTTPYWGEEPVFKDDKFFLWWLITCTETSEPPFDELNRTLSRFYLPSYNMALRLCEKWARNAEKTEEPEKPENSESPKEE